MATYLEDLEVGRPVILVPSETLRYHLEVSPRRVRAVLGSETIADSKRALLLREPRRLGVYYFPWSDVRREVFERSAKTSHSELKGPATYWNVRMGDRYVEDAAWSYESLLPEGPDLRDHVAIYWQAMDTWYEEDEEAFAHPRDPYKFGVDVRRSSRHVRVELAGTTIAETDRPILLFELGLPIRYYIPVDDVRMDLLEPSQTTSQCAYKGQASYWTAHLGDRAYPDVAWTYREPLVAAAPVAGYVAFFQERVSETIVDGETLSIPPTPWARPVE